MRAKPQLDFGTQLHTIPVRNQSLRVVESDPDSDALGVEVQLKKRGFVGLLARWVNTPPKKQYELAGLSRDLFEQLDGKRTVEELIDWLAAEEQLTFLEARALILHYLGDLMTRGLIVVLGEEGAGASGRSESSGQSE